MYGIFVNDKLIGTKNNIDDALISYSRLVNYFKILKKNYSRLNLILEEKRVVLENLIDNYIVQQTTISDL